MRACRGELEGDGDEAVVHGAGLRVVAEEGVAVARPVRRAVNTHPAVLSGLRPDYLPAVQRPG